VAEGAVERAAEALFYTQWHADDREHAQQEWRLAKTHTRQRWERKARAAIVAFLEAWEPVEVLPLVDNWAKGVHAR
jgi:hypothetical protein